MKGGGVEPKITWKKGGEIQLSSVAIAKSVLIKVNPCEFEFTNFKTATWAILLLQRNYLERGRLIGFSVSGAIFEPKSLKLNLRKYFMFWFFYDN